MEEKKQSKVFKYFKDLNTDEVKMDTKLAEEYLKNHNNEFRPTVNCSKKFVEDNVGNKIYCSDNSPIIKIIPHYTYRHTLYTDLILLKCLTNEIKNNAQLFAELEYLIRGVPQKDVHQYDVNLLIEHLKQISRDQYIGYYNPVPERIELKDNTPLCYLGFIVTAWIQSRYVITTASKNTAVISNLFIDLCYRVGFPEISLHLLIADESENPRKSLNSYTAAIVTEFSDLDSSADVILAAPTSFTYPWRLRRVIVQENVMERFVEAFRSKLSVDYQNNSPVTKDTLINTVKKLNAVGSGKMDENSTDLRKLVKKVADYYICDNKIVLFKFLGQLKDIPDCTPIFLVESYRTTKELFSLLKKYQVQHLSIWCNDISTVNQISFSSEAQNIWINNYGEFSCRDGVGRNFYYAFAYDQYNKVSISGLHTYLTSEKSEEIDKHIKKLIKKETIWEKETFEERKLMLVKAIKNCKSSVNTGIFKKIIQFEEQISSWNDGSYINVVKGKICQHINKPRGVIALIDEVPEHLLKRVINSVLNGNCLLLEVSLSSENSGDCNMFIDGGVPIQFINYSYNDRRERFQYLSQHKDVDLTAFAHDTGALTLYRPKTIWSSFGETFAN